MEPVRASVFHMWRYSSLLDSATPVFRALWATKQRNLDQKVKQLCRLVGRTSGTMSSNREKSKKAAKELLALCAEKGVKVPTVSGYRGEHLCHRCSRR